MDQSAALPSMLPSACRTARSARALCSRACRVSVLCAVTSNAAATVPTSTTASTDSVTVTNVITRRVSLIRPPTTESSVCLFPYSAVVG